jgi:hypothetical protein
VTEGNPLFVHELLRVRGSLGRYLAATVRTGNFCMYSPI